MDVVVDEEGNCGCRREFGLGVKRQRKSQENEAKDGLDSAEAKKTLMVAPGSPGCRLPVADWGLHVASTAGLRGEGDFGVARCVPQCMGSP